MFAAPPELTTEVFATLPEHLRSREPSEAVRRRNPSHVPHSFLEGPSFDRAGNLYCVDIYYGRVFRIAPDRSWSVIVQYDGEPNGLKVRQDGQIFIADRRHGIMQLDPSDGRIAPFCTRYNAEPFKGVNDLCFASTGDLYFTDQGSTGLDDPTGRVFRIRAEGRVDLLLDNAPSPNGLVLTADERTLLVAVTRHNSIWRVPLHPDTGAAYKVGVFIYLSGSAGGGPDGLALDVDGNLLVAQNGLGTVWQFTPDGEPRRRIRSCAGKKTTNVAYGGADRKTLFITESDSGSILQARLDVPGRAMASHL